MTSDHVAHAMVAACRATGEDPLAVASGDRYASRGRHYAFHALIEVFSDVEKATIARLVGAPLPKKYWSTSYHNVARCNASGQPMANWWDFEVLDGVVAAIRAVDAPIDLRSAIDLPPAAEWLPHASPNPAGAPGQPKPFRMFDAMLVSRRPRQLGLNITADLLGDPAPGRSALDHKKQEEAPSD